MRIVHTSDWHLGLSTGPASRLDEQWSFVRWLLGRLTELQADALIVAGDVFDNLHPSAEAQSLYYRFLAMVAATGVRDVVIVGGNHDSASRLDAPRELLQAVDVHVVGGVPQADLREERMVVPLRRRGSDEVGAVCLAVPYVHEYRLGIRTTDLDVGATRGAFREVFSGLYSDLADRAVEQWPGVPLVATGHLTLGMGSTRDDYPQEIHRVGTIDGLPVEIIDERIRYCALGHIHRSYRVRGSVAWYCGTPIPYSLGEMRGERRVLVVDVDVDGAVEVQPEYVPRQRDLLQLSGPPDVVIAAVRDLTWSTPLPPLVHVRVETQMAEPGLARRLHEALAVHPEGARPILVEVQQRARDLDVEVASVVHEALENLQPDEVFGLMCDARQLRGEERQALMQAFQVIRSATPQVLDEIIQGIELPPSADEVS